MTIIRLLDGTKAYLHAVIDNFSRRILAWRVSDRFERVNTVCVLRDALAGRESGESTPMLVSDSGVENVNSQVDELAQSGVIRHVLALTDLTLSNSMIEAWFRSVKHQCLFLHSLDTVGAVRNLVEQYVHEHNAVIPHSAFDGQTPDEVYFGTGDSVPDLDRRSEGPSERRALGREPSCVLQRIR